MKKKQTFKRGSDTGMYSRLSGPGKPKSLDEAARSVEFVVATEQPVTMYDWDRGEVDEVLLIDGVVIPPNGQVPLADSHDRSTVDNIIGSVRDFKKAEVLLGTGFFSKKQKAFDTYRDYADGHLTDVSVGYVVVDAIFCDPGQAIEYKGRKFQATPERALKVSTKWELKEVSAVAVGADSMAKARGEPKPDEHQPVKPAQPALKTEEVHFKMNRKLFNLLILRGMAAGSTDAEALAYLNALPPTDQEALRAESIKPDASPVNEAEIAERAERAVMERISTIKESCRAAGVPEIADDLAKACRTVEEARAKIIEELAKRRPAVPVTVQVQADEGDKFRAAAVDGFLAREGIRIDNPAAGHEDFRHRTPWQLAEECLQKAGHNTRSMSRERIVKTAMGLRGSETIAHGTAHFPLILESIASKMVLQGFNEEEEFWRLICAIKDVSDFREFSMTGISGAEDLDEIQELAPYTEGEFNERREKAKLVKWGKKFSYSWEAALADTLGEFTTVPRRHGQSAKRLLNKLAVAILTSNAAMSDGVALFHANHANILAAAALSSTSLGDMEALMGKQTGHGKDSEPLDIQLTRLVTGRKLKRTSHILCDSPTLSDSSIPAGYPNPNAGVIIPISTGLITSDTAFYGLADPNKYDVLIMAFLGGKQSPDLEQITQTDVDGIAFKVRMCAVAKALDWLGVAYCAGA